MRDIHVASLDKSRPVLVLTRAPVRAAMSRMTVGSDNGLDQASVVCCDNIITISKSSLGRHVGFLFDHQENDLARAITNAFTLRQP